MYDTTLPASISPILVAATVAHDPIFPLYYHISKCRDLRWHWPQHEPRCSCTGCWYEYVWSTHLTYEAGGGSMHTELLNKVESKAFRLIDTCRPVKYSRRGSILGCRRCCGASDPHMERGPQMSPGRIAPQLTILSVLTLPLTLFLFIYATFVEHHLSSTKPHLLFLIETQLSVTTDSCPFSVP